MATLVYPLEDAPEEATAVGGKALGLGRLLRAGLTVPPGFVLTADAFRAFLQENGLDHLAGTVADGSAPDTAAVLAWFRAGTWPIGLRTEVEAAYEALRARSDGCPVAARSSATAEDGAAASFAGQHATLLNLDGIDAVLDGILSCWASLFSEEALFYRRSRGIDDEGPAMAVVVQALVPSESAGVAFTLDPVSGDRDLVVIEGAWGLGEALVSGMVTPDHFAVRKSDGAIVRRQLSPKRLRIAPASGGGTQTQELSGEEVDAPAISDEHACELARLAQRVEDMAGVPQDIEWALAGGTLYLLQARPITAVGLETPAPAPAALQPTADIPADGWVSEFDTPTAPHTVWTAANVQEVLPDQLSPFSCSVTLAMMEQFGTKPVERTGIKLRTPDPFSGYFYGRAFLNASMTVDVADQIPFGSPEAAMQQFYGEILGEIPERHLSPGRVMRYALVLPRMLWFTARMPAEIHRAERTVEQMEREAAAHAPAAQSDEELLATLERFVPLSGEVTVTHVSGAGLTSSNFEWLRNCTRDWLNDETGSLHATLCSGLASLESAQPAYELWELSRLVVASDQLQRAFEPHNPVEIAARLSAQENGDVAVFRKRFGEFLSRHGHRSIMEADIAAMSWEEDHPTVLAMVRNYLHADASADPRIGEERQRREREQATQDALKRLAWRRRVVFRNILKQAQTWVAMREHTKSLMVRTIYLCRRITRELARRAGERGLLDRTWDFYYLTWDETKSLIRGTLSRDEALASIARRRDEEERNRHVVLPDTFRGRPKPLTLEEQALPDDRVLHGLAVSPGRVTAKARVILDPRKDASIEPGEILIAPVTDAGWTPLFIAAAGVVVDIGGSLSHGSTVAREYGLPAVVNVKHGTRMITTGQTITVDGTLGVVILEDDA